MPPLQGKLAERFDRLRLGTTAGRTFQVAVFFLNPRMLRVAISWLEGGFWCCGPRNSVSNPSRGGVGVTACPIRAVGGFAHPVFFWLSFAWSLSRWLSFFWLSLFLFVAFLWLELTGVCQFQYHPVMSPKTWYFISYQVYGIMFY